MEFIQQLYENDLNSPEHLHMFFAIARSKNNPELTANSQPIIRKLVKRADLIPKLVNELELECKQRGYKFYIYASITPRDVTKAYRAFKDDLTAKEHASLFGKGDMYDILRRIDDRWYRALMIKNAAGSPTRFVLDIDTNDKEAIKYAKNQIENISYAKHQPEVLHTLKTRNGYHMITTPFSPDDFDSGDWPIEVKKDDPVQIGTVGFTD
jgi:hypothetical protein